MAIYTVPQHLIASTDDERFYPNPFTPIGLNKPLTVQIRHVYTGKFP